MLHNYSVLFLYASIWREGHIVILQRGLEECEQSVLVIFFGIDDNNRGELCFVHLSLKIKLTRTLPLCVGVVQRDMVLIVILLFM